MAAHVPTFLNAETVSDAVSAHTHDAEKLKSLRKNESFQDTGDVVFAKFGKPLPKLKGRSDIESPKAGVHISEMTRAPSSRGNREDTEVTETQPVKTQLVTGFSRAPSRASSRGAPDNEFADQHHATKLEAVEAFLSSRDRSYDPGQLSVREVVEETGLSTAGETLPDHDSEDEQLGVYSIALYQKEASPGSSRAPRLSLDAISREVTMRKKKKSSSIEYIKDSGKTFQGVLRPTGKFMKTWDVLMCLLLAFTATVTPFEIAFLHTSLDVLFFVNRVVDLLFIVDIVITCFLPYTTARGKLITRPKDIQKHYVLEFPYKFWVDLVSVVPFDVIGHYSKSDSTEKVKIVRTIRLLRLSKLFRILRAGRMFSRWESSLAIDYMILSLGMYLVSMLMLAHWFACMWGMILELQGNVYVFEGEAMNWVRGYDFVSEASSSSSVYIASLYWAVATLSTLGYGDVVPTTDGERIYAILCSVFGTCAYTYSVGAVCTILAAFNRRTTDFYMNMDYLNRFIRDKRLGPELAGKLRSFYRYKHSQELTVGENLIFETLSQSLRTEVAVVLHSQWIQQIPFFQGSKKEFVMMLSTKLEALHFPPAEAIIKLNEVAEWMYIVQKGVVVCKSVVLLKGKAIGTDLVYRNFRRTYTAACLTNVSCLALHRTSLLLVLERFPVTAKRLKKITVRMIFRDTLKAYAAAVRAGVDSPHADSEIDAAKDPRTVLDKIFSPDIMPLVYKHRLQILSKEKPQQAQHVHNAVLVMQRYARMSFQRRRQRKLLQIMGSGSDMQRSFARLCNTLDAVKHLDKFTRHKILGPEQIAQLQARDLVFISPEMTFGDALAMVNGCRKIMCEEDERNGTDGETS